jgi:hypothetical protein
LKPACAAVVLLLGLQDQQTNLNTLPADLETPKMIEGEPAAGKRVRRTLAGYEGTQVYHALYLPTDWERGKKYSVIVEYAGNGGYRNAHGDVSPGTPEGSNLGYGASGGRGFVWLCLPYVDPAGKKNQLTWWGDPDATTDYGRKAVREACEKYGGDPAKLVLAGFSRGAIACNYLGLRDDETARPWRAFIAHSHYDGVRRWGYAGDDPEAAKQRLARLGGRPQWISHERSVDDTRAYIEGTGVKGDFTFTALPYPNHTDAWVLRDLPERRKLREWLARVLK